MSRLLTQSEIDALLEVREEVESGNEPSIDALENLSGKSEEKVTPYNFKRPKLFAHDQIRVLNHLHDSFARDLSGYLSAQLRTIVDISLVAVDQVLYSEYVHSSAPPSALYIISATEQDQEFVFEFDPRLAIFTVEKLFGGNGVFLDEPRELSMIEERIMDKVMTRVYRELEQAWEAVHPVELEKSGFESNAEFVQVLPAVEPAIVVTLEVLVYDHRCLINICYPYILLERLLTRTGMKRWMSSMTSEVDEETRMQFEDTVRNVTVELRANLGHSEVSLEQLSELEKGDVIPLDRRIDDPVEVLVEDRLRFQAAVGHSRNQRALQILDVLESRSPSTSTPSESSETDDE